MNVVDLRPVPREETYACYCKSGQEPTVGELTGPR